MSANDGQDFWFPINPGEEESPAYLIKIPKRCTQCQEELIINTAKPGSKDEMSFLDHPCCHVWDWNDLLSMRLDKPEPKEKKEDKGGFCVKCNLHNKYMDGPYTCYSCKQPH